MVLKWGVGGMIFKQIYIPDSDFSGFLRNIQGQSSHCTLVYTSVPWYSILEIKNMDLSAIDPLTKV